MSFSFLIFEIFILIILRDLFILIFFCWNFHSYFFLKFLLWPNTKCSFLRTMIYALRMINQVDGSFNRSLKRFPKCRIVLCCVHISESNALKCPVFWRDQGQPHLAADGRAETRKDWKLKTGRFVFLSFRDFQTKNITNSLILLPQANSFKTQFFPE